MHMMRLVSFFSIVSIITVVQCAQKKEQISFDSLAESALAENVKKLGGSNEVTAPGIIAKKSVIIRQDAVVDSDVFVLEKCKGANCPPKGVELLVGRRVFGAEGHSFKAQTVKVKRNANIDIVEADDPIVSSQAVVSQVITPLGSLPGIPPFLTGVSGSSYVTHTNSPLSSGIYKDLIVKKNKTIELIGGFYHFREVKLGRNVTLNCQSNCVILVKKTFLAGRNLNMRANSNDPNDLTIYVRGKKQKKSTLIRRHSSVISNIYNLRGILKIGRGSTARGNFISEHVKIGRSSLIKDGNAPEGVSKVISAVNGGFIELPGEINATFPANALSEDTLITIRPVTSVAPNSPAGLSMTGLGQTYEILPDGLSLNQPVILTMNYDQLLVDNAGIGENQLELFTTSSSLSAYEAAGAALGHTRDELTNTIAVHVDHFSLFQVGYYENNQLQAVRDLIFGSNYVYALSFSFLEVIDVSNPTNPTLVFTYNFPDVLYPPGFYSPNVPQPERAWDMVLEGNFLYIVAQHGGLFIFDVSTPSAPVVVYTPTVLDMRHMHHVDVEGNTLIGADHNGRSVQFVDVTNRAAPIIGPLQLIPTAPFDRAAFKSNNGEIRLTSTHFYYSVDGRPGPFFYEKHGIEVIDYTGPSLVRLSGYNEIKGQNDIWHMAEAGNFIYLSVCGVDNSESDDFNGIRILDATNPAAINHVGDITLPLNPIGFYTQCVVDLEVRGNKLWTVTADEDVAAYDITNPASPVLIEVPFVLPPPIPPATSNFPTELAVGFINLYVGGIELPGSQIFDPIGNIRILDISLLGVPDVLPRYTNNGANWNDYVIADGSDVTNASDTACTGAETGGYSACVHGGEILSARLSNSVSCSSATYTATDALDAFNWVCTDIAGIGHLVSMGLKTGRSLADLIDFSTNMWRNNSLTILQNGVPFVTTVSQPWHNNVIHDLAGGGILNVPGTIYVLNSSATFTPQILADKVGLAVAPGQILSGPTILPSNPGTVMCTGLKFVWITATVEQNDNSSGIRLDDCDFSVVENSSVNDASGVFFSMGLELINGSDNNLIRQFSSQNNGFGIKTSSSISNTFESIKIHSTLTNGIDISNGNGQNLIRVQIANSSSTGLRLVDTASSRLVEVSTSNNGGHGISIQSTSGTSASRGNILNNILSANNALSGIVIDDGPDSIINQSTISGNGLWAVAINNNSDNVLINNLLASSTEGILIRNSNGNSISNVAVRNIEIDGGGSHFFTNRMIRYTSNCPGGGAGSGILGNCLKEGASNHIVRSLNQAPALEGPLSIDETVNSSDSNGQASYSTITDWHGFENSFRAWGLATGAPGLPRPGRCTPGETCRIIDWRLSTTDVQAKDILHWPKDGSIFATSHTFGSGSVTFLDNASEIMGDGQGNENGLCESNEQCLFTPNLGTFQGSGPLVLDRTVANGTISNVTLYHFGVAPPLDPIFINLVSPANGNSIPNFFTLMTEVREDIAVDRVQFFINGTLTQEVFAPNELTFIQGTGNGLLFSSSVLSPPGFPLPGTSYDLRVVVFDTEGNFFTDDDTTVTFEDDSSSQ